ncbi:MAG TPA: heme-binding domain-containing protein [Fulvivirga sp.]|nr:heme-binding domain-containing protein [Fulvivirga sp.]
MKLKTKIIAGLVFAIIIIQFFRIDKTNPNTDPSNDLLAMHEASIEVSEILKNACYDCHSNKTEYPWYSNVAPVSWWLKDHVDHARGHLNFSDWGTYDLKKKKHKLEEVYEEVEEGEMPLDSYTWVHEEAELTAEQRELLIAWAKKTRSEL